MEHRLFKSIIVFSVLFLILGGIGIPLNVYATSSITYVDGKVYEFEEDNDYEFSKATSYLSSSNTTTYGQFSIYGNDSELAATGQKGGVNAYSVKEGSITISYKYSDFFLNATDEEWHLIDDNEKNVDLYKLDNSIQKGALILQRSIDHLNWSDVSIQTNVFEEMPIQNDPLYESLEVELINGCYYRLIVVYELSRKVGSSKVLWIIPKDEYEYKRIAEVYEFYTEMDNEHIEPLQTNTKRYRLGETTKASDFASYSGSQEIKKDDLHYNWTLGNFFVSGFTSTCEKNGDIVFLKNVGDEVTLWFNLTQDIDALNNNKDLSITADGDGHDQYFQTDMTIFGRGMLIIQYTDYENVKHDPVMYYNYLEANTSFGADTRVKMFEEGDYEVALDYEVTKDQLIDKVGHYRIFFKFSVRNANCMVFPLDVKTGAELTNTSVTPNGFSLDLARSRYLKIYIEKEIWTEGADGLTKDTRFNTTAKDGDKYTDEGIYTITVENEYTGLKTTKVIYVGTNRILLAYMTSNYSLAEIQELVSKGATIYEDGSIELPPETYAVKHEFLSGTAGMALPDAINNLLPTDQAGIKDGEEVIPGVVQENSFIVDGGMWLFQGWDAEKKVVDRGNLLFVGVWVFEKDTEALTEPTSESFTNDEPESEPQSTSEEISSKYQESEADAKPSTENGPDVITQESRDEADTHIGNDSLFFIIVGIVITLGLVVFFISRKRNNKEEDQR